MFYAVFYPPESNPPDDQERLPAGGFLYNDIKDATLALKRYKGSRMKTFSDSSEANQFLRDPRLDTSLDEAESFLLTELENLSIDDSQATTPRRQRQSQLIQNSPRRPQAPPPPPPPTPTQAPTTIAADGIDPVYPSAKPGLLNQLRRKIEAGDREGVEEMIWSNPRYLVTVCDSAVYLMAGPKYNACHIAARANKPGIVALILTTVSNPSFLRKLYPRESDENVQDRFKHLLDSYLNTPDPKLGNTPLHFACKLGHYQVVRVLLTFEGCDLTLRDSMGQTAEESICSQAAGSFNDEEGDKIGGESNSNLKQRIKMMLRHQPHTPSFRDRLKKRLEMERRRSRASSQIDSDTSFSDWDESFILGGSPAKQQQRQGQEEEQEREQQQ